MNEASQDLAAMVFRRVVRKDMGAVSLRPEMLSVLFALDGKTPFGIVARNLGLNMAGARRVVAELERLGLIEIDPAALTYLGPDFFSRLQAHLAMAIGPFASVMIEEALEDLGTTAARFPSHLAPRLVEALAKQIDDGQERVRFTQAMVTIIQAKGVQP